MSPATSPNSPMRKSFSPLQRKQLPDTLPPAAGLETPSSFEGPLDVPPVLPPPRPEPVKVERSADVVHLTRRVKRWRRVTLAMGAIAAVLALYIAGWQFAPDLLPPQLRSEIAQMMPARSEAPARGQQDRLVAVLQPGPAAPAFLVTLDTQQRTLTVRKVSATAEAGKSYELWLISSRLGAPRSLGTVGDDEFTQRPLPGNYDVDTLRGATYAVSLEPAGGSKAAPRPGRCCLPAKLWNPCRRRRPKHRRRSVYSLLTNGGKVPADGRRVAGSDQRYRAKINVAGDASENSDRGDHGREHETDDDNLQVRSTVRAVHRVVHGVLAGFSFITLAAA